MEKSSSFNQNTHNVGLTGAFVVVALAISSCSAQEGDAQSTIAPQAEKSMTETYAPSRAPVVGRVAEPLQTPSIKKVPIPWTAGEMQKGIQVYWNPTSEGTSHEALVNRGESILEYVVDMGANSVGVVFPIYTDGPWPTTVYETEETPTIEEMSAIVVAAKDRNLRVTLRPLIDEKNIMVHGEHWRGSIQPQNVEKWFSDYQTLLTGYAEIAQKHGVEEFVIGAELTSLESYTDQWQRAYDAIQSVYDGEISYAINFPQYPQFGPVGRYAVDAYPEIALDSSASVQQLTDAWSDWLSRAPAEVRTQTVLQEVGIPAQEGAYTRPYSWGTGKSARNDSVQANWFAAACNAAYETGMEGIYYWVINSGVNMDAPNPDVDGATSFVGREAAERAIRACFYGEEQ